MKALKLNNTTLWVFLLCAVIVVITQFLLLDPLIKYSLFSEDDWKWLLGFRSLPYFDIFSKSWIVWIKVGIHEGGYAIYMGILGTIFGDNYSTYQYVNVISKIIATLTIFPLILILFKNKLLAFLTTIFFAISSASTGSMYWYMKGGVFLGIALMNLFFILYYYSLLKGKKIILFFSSILIFLAYLFSPTRIYPAFLIIVGIEAYWLLRHKSLISLKQSIVRLIFFLLPTIIISMVAPISPEGSPQKEPFILLNQLIHGNWYNLLSPFAAMGYSLLTNGAWKYFGAVDYSTFVSLNNYLTLLFIGSFLVFLLSLFFLFFFAFTVSKRPLRFIIATFSTNFILDILLFVIVNRYLVLPSEFVTKLDPSLFNITKYPTLVAFFILSISFTTFLEWLKKKKNLLLIPVFVGPLFAFIFLFPMWVNVGFLLDGYSSTQYYYQIPAIGMSLFLSSVLVLIYGKFKKKFLRILILLFIAGVIFKFYRASSIEINHEFLPIYPERVKVADQKILHDKLIEKLGNPDKEGNLLVYFEIPNEYFLFNYYKRSLLLDSNSFASMINWRKYRNGPGCVGNVSDINILKSSFIFDDGRWGFRLNGKCQEIGAPPPDNFYDYNIFVTLDYQPHSTFYSLDSLYAYKIEKGEIIDIKDDVLKQLKIP